jgi:hypothetical protein
MKGMEKMILKLTNALDNSTLENSQRMLRSFYRTIEPHYRRNWKDPERISWEIYAEKDDISFYVVVPYRIRNLIKSRILDAYPQVEIKEVEHDYVSKFNKPFTARMDLNKHYMFATKMKADDTPINSILNSMSRLEDGEKMLLQISLLPINNRWQGKAYQHYRSILFDSKRKPKPFRQKSLLAKGIVYSVKGVFELVGWVIGQFIPFMEDDQKNTPIEKEELKATQAKIALPAFNASIRLAAESKDRNTMSIRLSEISNSFIEIDGDNEWRRQKGDNDKVFEEIKERKVDRISNNKVTTTELSPIVRLANKNVYVTELTRKILKTLPIPQGLEGGLFFGKGIHNSTETDVYIPTDHIDDLVHPMIITGAMGAGKTTLITNNMLARANQGYSVIMIDTQGDMSQDFIKQIPQKDWSRVVWLNFGDLQYPVALDLMEFITLGGGSQENADFVKDWAKDELISLMKKMWGTNFGPQTEYITRHNITATIETGGTFIEMLRMLQDDKFREEIISKIRFKSPMAWSFWRTFQDNFSAPQRMRMVMPSINKIGSFVEARAIRNITSQGKQNYNFRQMMDEGKIVVVTIPKGVLVGDSWKLIASLVVSKVWLAALSRHNQPIQERKPCFLACDEAEDVISDNFPIMLSQSRKYRLGINMGFQYLDQLRHENRQVYNAVIGNRPHIVAMKPGQKDAEVFAEIFKDYYNKEELERLPNLHGIARLSINGTLATPFTLRIPYNFYSRDNSPHTYITGGIEQIQDTSRTLYAKSKDEVETIVQEKYNQILNNMAMDIIDADYEMDEADDDLLAKLKAI